MFTNQFFTLSFLIALGKRYVTKFLLASSILASAGMAFLPVPKAFTSPINGNSIVRSIRNQSLREFTRWNAIHLYRSMDIQ